MLSLLQWAILAVVPHYFGVSAAPLPDTPSSNCKAVQFSVSGSAMNRNITGLSLSQTNLAQLLSQDAFPRILVSGPQTLAGIYCEPTVNNSNAAKLQILFHGITTNRLYYNALGGSLGFPAYQQDKYDYVQYANGQGYPTLSIDRLGNGLSSHPDPVLVVQGPYEYALYHDLVQKIKAGTTGALPQSFNDLIYVGHSYGSVVGNEMAHLYPQDFETTVLTGFTKSVIPSLPGVALQLPLPAAVQDSARFSALPVGYVADSSEQGRTNSLFSPNGTNAYDTEVATLFFQRQDVVSLGQVVTLYTDITPAPEYKGRVLVLTGEDDELFCALGSSALGPANCGSLIPDTKTLFPNAPYNYHSVANTGHVINLHYTAPDSDKVIHEFLGGTDFSG